MKKHSEHSTSLRSQRIAAEHPAPRPTPEVDRAVATWIQCGLSPIQRYTELENFARSMERASSVLAAQRNELADTLRELRDAEKLYERVRGTSVGEALGAARERLFEAQAEADALGDQECVRDITLPFGRGN